MDPKERQWKAVRVAKETAAEQVYVAWGDTRAGRLQKPPFWLLCTSDSMLFLTCVSTLTVNVVWSHMVIISSMSVVQKCWQVGILLLEVSFWCPVSSDRPVVPQVFIASTSPSSKRRLGSDPHLNSRSRYIRINMPMGTGSYMQRRQSYACKKTRDDS